MSDQPINVPFTATEDFFSDETQSQYCEGLSYTARDQKLLDLATKWVDEGKAIWGAQASQVEAKE